MPQILTSDQVNEIISIQGQAIAGLGGAPTLPRATEVRGITKVFRFTIEADTPNPMPGSVATPPAVGDTFIIGLMEPTDRIYMIAITFTTDWGGTAPTVFFGKIDPNNPANTDLSHYSSAFALDGTLATPMFADINMTEQVGDDPQGDQSVGNKSPGFGAQKIQITATLGGTSVDPDTGTITGFILLVEEGN